MDREALAKDPGNPAFVDVALGLLQAGQVSEAMSVCFSGLSANPTMHRGRLLLAQMFFDQGYLPFAVRELEILAREVPESKFLQSLLRRLSGGAGSQGAQEDGTLAEAEFDIGQIDLLADDDKGK